MLGQVIGQLRHRHRVRSLCSSARLYVILGGGNVVRLNCTAHRHEKYGHKLGATFRKWFDGIQKLAAQCSKMM